MFEVLKFVLETLASAFSLSKIRESKRKKQLAAIGGDLFMLYLSLNKVIVCGYAILERLRHAVFAYERDKAMTVWSSDGKQAIHLWYRLLPLQAQNLGNLLASLERLEPYVAAVDAGAARKLYPLLSGKARAIEWLRDQLAEKQLPLGELQPNELSEFAESVASSDDPGFEGSFRFERFLTEKMLAVPLRIGDQEYERVKAYLAERDPETELKELEQHADSMREAIAANFSIQDVLLKVKDARLTLG